jgi:geranylgeranyl diphosphate synthase type I
MNPDVERELAVLSRRVRRYLLDEAQAQPLKPAHLSEAAMSYVALGGKHLRPAMLTWSCIAMGGSARDALPAAAAVELYHTWTMIHDDIIDRDERRRGGPTVHAQFQERAARELHLDPEAAAHYGLSLALLAGDVGHAAAVTLLRRCPLAERNPGLILRLVAELEGEVLAAIASGEALDLLYAHCPIQSVSERQILNMYRGKTARIYAFAARAGALLGLGQNQRLDGQVRALEHYGLLCGIAYQLQDDILGLVADERRLGKPVGSDIREGKRTTILCYAWRHASRGERERLEQVLGNPCADARQIRDAISILRRRQGLAHTRRLARQYAARAIAALAPLPASNAKRLLAALAWRMVRRAH